MKLSLEIPTAYLKDWSPLTDLDFALAHLILEDDEYCEHHFSRPKGRELVLDNSMHELGKPLSAAELHEAAKRCRADFVIPPDQLGQVQQNYAWYKQTHRLLGNQFKLAVVMCGHDPAERESFLMNIAGASMLCLPYREPRWEWYLDHHQTIRRLWTRVHLLGVNDLNELQNFSRESSQTRSVDWSVDTRKPIKWGVQKRRLDDVVKNIGSLRGGHALEMNDLFRVRNLTCSQTEAVLWNIAYLRRFCA